MISILGWLSKIVVWLQFSFLLSDVDVVSDVFARWRVSFEWDEVLKQAFSVFERVMGSSCASLLIPSIANDWFECNFTPASQSVYIDYGFNKII